MTRYRGNLKSLFESTITGFSAVECAVLRLWMYGEQRTSVFIREIGMANLPPQEQRAAVKRVKDRIFKRLRQ